MQIPFTVEQFYGVFSACNMAIWPAQIFLPGLALIAIALLAAQRRFSGVGISGILAFLWAWQALAYHLAFFTAINPLAYVFAAVFFAGAIVFFWQGVVRRKLDFKVLPGGRKWVGLSLIVFSLAVYPAWSYFAGHRYPAFPTFGLPCPTTLFTIGLLAFLVRPYSRSPFVVPVLWCLVGSQAAFLLSVPADSGLAVAGVVGLVLLAQSKGAAFGPGRVL
ncbi:DUF6064 family protein [Polaromonas sp.]|uniref:DUF6064 family protein n=1 Tax=Polaromonas sp. TaxID=1869339 RepID=UPI0025D186AB|nr:DUF6064 family protein [Polaromonas sp.]